jgi:predicted alpha/beta superfamily hydrolase
MSRDDEYTHSYDIWEKTGGSSYYYADFITLELKPFIDRKYRTKRKREHTGIIGSSLGGLVSLFIGFEKQKYFKHIGAMSPSVWWSDNDILNFVIYTDLKYEMNFYIDAGFNEGDYKRKNGVPEMIRGIRKLKTILQKKRKITEKNIFYYEDVNGFHNEESWAKRFHMPLKFFFKKTE